jgi:hypothetical protein
MAGQRLDPAAARTAFEMGLVFKSIAYVILMVFALASPSPW